MSALDVEALLDFTANGTPTEQNGTSKSKDPDDRYKSAVIETEFGMAVGIVTETASEEIAAVTKCGGKPTEIKS
jgi:hypothetical protein